MFDQDKQGRRLPLIMVRRHVSRHTSAPYVDITFPYRVACTYGVQCLAPSRAKKRTIHPALNPSIVLWCCVFHFLVRFSASAKGATSSSCFTHARASASVVPKKRPGATRYFCMNSATMLELEYAQVSTPANPIGQSIIIAHANKPASNTHHNQLPENSPGRWLLLYNRNPSKSFPLLLSQSVDSSLRTYQLTSQRTTH